ncbi:DJ-1/PfpI family protein [Nigerium massiliense]|uniref:DJ-1/PfpI family protein n=1 Tax=Nigerium massiliense TaxID=1522317 RepID=UPI000590348D|nr:DJ-1/PfpI family protein [Nigerium massiliense]
MAEKKILIVSTDFGTERDELTVPLRKLKDLGHQVSVATPSGEDVQTFVGDRDRDEVVPTDLKLADASGPYDVIVLPGGTLNADAGRMDEGIRAIVKEQAGAGRPVAAICHAPWVLVDTELASGKNLTSYTSVRPDLQNAGATWHDQSVVTCDANGWTLITSRNPDDLDDFVGAIDAL